MEEIWKDINGYEGLYQISNLGNARSSKSGRILLFDYSNGYLRVRLSKNGKVKTKRVHILVASHFIVNPENFPQVNHKDGNKHNNYFTNLEWNTHSMNMRHRFEILENKKRGAYYHHTKKRWLSQIGINHTMIHLGYFDSKEEAQKAFYDKYLEVRGTPPWTELNSVNNE
jgi:NUMOD4 motif